MADEPEFRIGDVEAGIPASGSASRASKGSVVDAGLFPTLAAWLELSPPERKDRVDALAARARGESSPEIQAALQAAVRLLTEIASSK
jgi:hypothetical protein